ncbi:MAG: dUTP diphosphatase [Bradyrhizobiaceae bacterium]|nr:dUTP diphosphatase [Bradyrhizobiaceae bacterium]
MRVAVVQLDGAADLPLPHYATDGAAGMDVYAAVDQTLTIPPHGIVMVPTGLCIAVPSGFECQVRSRSGLAAKHGVFALNAPGTIDSDYRGEIQIILANFSANPFVVERGMRIAQLVIAKHERITWERVDVLTETNRGAGGFGSTGIMATENIEGQ